VLLQVLLRQVQEGALEQTLLLLALREALPAEKESPLLLLLLLVVVVVSGLSVLVVVLALVLL
jgi:hypothetical protein